MTEKAPLAAVIAANVETLDQGIETLVSISCTTYTKVINPVMSSSIGSHIRHIADTYRAVINGLSSKQVDFNFRRRNTAIESDLSKALAELRSIRYWLQNLDEKNDLPLQIITEVALAQTKTVNLNSSLARELVFASSHAIHHFAQIATLARLQGFEIDPDLGVAAATASYRRNFAIAG
jgi:uncharacterized damage-inducible protein DinB